MGRVIWVGYKVAGSLDRGHQGRERFHFVLAIDTISVQLATPTHYDSASVNIGVKANGLESTHNHLAGDPTHYEYIGVKAKLLAQLLAGSRREHPKRPASDPTHYDSASVNIGVKANGLESTHNHLAGDPTHYEYIGVKAKLLAQLLAGSRREHPWFYT
ncbi:hypothetical protein B0H14DRAFT_2642705 [Mycena olivaceomarginata]|nr:hypothetical protein B0H14DRAFT_2642705 [Mycena olivaceomarginata]